MNHRYKQCDSRISKSRKKNHSLLLVALVSVFLALETTAFTAVRLEDVTISRKSPQCTEESCARFDVTVMRVVEGLPREIALKVNERIVTRVINLYEPSEIGIIEDRAKEFLDGFAEAARELERPAGEWFVLGTMVQSFQSPSILSLKYSEESFAGGAHGSQKTIFLNFDLTTGEELAFNELFGSRLSEVFQIAESTFRKAVEIDAKTPLAESNFFEPNHQFALAAEWGITPQGILLFYNQYEAAPGALGSIEVLLPKTSVAPLLDRSWSKIFTPGT